MCVEAEYFITGEMRHTASAYLTFVSLDSKGPSVAVPPLILETEEERRRNQEVMVRRVARLIEKKEERGP